MIRYSGRPPSWALIGVLLKAHYRGAFAPGEIIRIGRSETNHPSRVIVAWAMFWCLAWRLRGYRVDR